MIRSRCPTSSEASTRSRASSSGRTSDAVGWGVSAICQPGPCGLARCPSVACRHVGGDRGAITVRPSGRPPRGCDVDRALLVVTPGGPCSPAVACVPRATRERSRLAGSSGRAFLVAATWIFTVLDPAAGRRVPPSGYVVLLQCHPGFGTLPKPCTSPVNQSGLADGVHVIRVYAGPVDGPSRRPSSRTRHGRHNGADRDRPSAAEVRHQPSAAVRGPGLMRSRHRQLDQLGVGSPLTGDVAPGPSAVAISPIVTTRTYSSLMPRLDVLLHRTATRMLANLGRRGGEVEEGCGHRDP